MNAPIHEDNTEKISHFNSIDHKHWFNVVVSIFMIIWGLVGLTSQMFNIFLRYPDFYKLILNSNDMNLYIILLQQIFFVSLTNFATSAYGLAMLVKPSNTVKMLNILVMAVLIGLTIYFNRYFQISPDIIHQINQLSI